MNDRIDVDFWIGKPASLKTLAPYMSQAWREWTRAQEGARPARLPESKYFLAGPDLQAAIDAPDPAPLIRARLDALGPDALAIINPGTAASVSGYGNPVLAADVARATNDLTRTHLDTDPRLRGSIVIGPRDPDAAASEIRRAVAADTRMIQVLLSYPQQQLGHRRLRPILQAASELGLPVMLEASGAHAGSNGGLTTIGTPVDSFQALLSWESAAQTHLVSLLSEGIFTELPDLRVVFSGFGVGWLPSLLWRLDHEYRTQRVTRPTTMTQPPSEHVPANVRFTTATLELPADPIALADALEPAGGAHLLLLGSGPLGGDTEANTLLNAAGPEWTTRVTRQNALEHYGLS